MPRCTRCSRRAAPRWPRSPRRSRAAWARAVPSTAARLGRAVLDEPGRLRRLEAIVHPLVRAAEGGFLRRACRAGCRLVVLDIPLLFETGGEGRVDAVAVVSANPMLQAQRALRRPGMTADKLARIRAEQLPDRRKRKRADFVIPSGYDRGALASMSAGSSPPAARSREHGRRRWSRRLSAIQPGQPAVGLAVEGEPARAPPRMGSAQAGGAAAGSTTRITSIGRSIIDGEPSICVDVGRDPQPLARLARAQDGRVAMIALSASG